jgi:hypothetical protein
MRRALTAVVGVILLLAGCAEEPAKETTGTSGAAWEGPPAADESGSIPVDTFNAFLETADPRLSRSPIRAAVEFVGLEEPAALTTSVVQEQPSIEGGDEVIVTVTSDGLPDDSVRAVRYVLEFRQEEAGWRVHAATTAQACQPGRGHQDFSPEPCI